MIIISVSLKPFLSFSASLNQPLKKKFIILYFVCPESNNSSDSKTLYKQLLE